MQRCGRPFRNGVIARSVNPITGMVDCGVTLICTGRALHLMARLSRVFGLALLGILGPDNALKEGSVECYLSRLAVPTSCSVGVL